MSQSHASVKVCAARQRHSGASPRALSRQAEGFRVTSRFCSGAQGAPPTPSSRSVWRCTARSWLVGRAAGVTGQDPGHDPGGGLVLLDGFRITAPTVLEIATGEVTGAHQTTNPSWGLRIRPRTDRRDRALIEGHNERAQPFLWTKTADEILSKASKQQATSRTPIRETRRRLVQRALVVDVFGWRA